MSSNHFSGRWVLLMVTLGALFLMVICPTTGIAGESGHFSGTWIANGEREKFPFSDDRMIYTFSLSGHVNLETSLGKQKDYWSDCVGLADSVSGVVARCVWKDLNGPRVYITLQSEKLQQDNAFSGTIVGGTDHLKGITGELSFLWSSLSFQDEEGKSSVTGQTLNLQGSYQIP
jgi:hypothetical protein